MNTISAGLKFAKKYNLRVTIKNTGHDFLGRSAGAGSLEIWTRYLRPSTQFPIVFHDVYAPTQSCAAVQKGGSSVQLGGAVTFDDVYPQAHQKGVVAVGGTCHSVGMTGGYLQGGGHGAARHQYGLGTDQVLKYSVVLANGSTVLASPCSNPDLFQALGGGGPGTLVSADASPPGRWCARLAAWVAWNGTSSLAPPSRMLEMITGVLNQTVEQVQSTMAPVMANLALYKSRGLDVTLQLIPFPGYFSYTSALQNNSMAIGGGILMSSRFYEQKHLTAANTAAIRQMVNVTAGLPGQNTSVVVDITGGGAVVNAPPLTGVNPAYRRAPLTNIVARNWDDVTP
ncbi:hypothetical protein V8C34DRAFT_310248 [Trichoderma compactum]